MTKIIALFALLALVGTAQAQNKLSYAKRDSLTGTGVTTTAKNTRGYDCWQILSPGINPIGYTQRMLAIQFSKYTDTAYIQGGTIDFGTLPGSLPWSGVSSGKVDTVWYNLELVNALKSAGFKGGTTWFGQHDTIFQYISPVTTDKNKFWFDLSGSKYCFPVYRIVNGVNDSGKTYWQLYMSTGM